MASIRMWSYVEMFLLTNCDLDAIDLGKTGKMD